MARSTQSIPTREKMPAPSDVTRLISEFIRKPSPRLSKQSIYNMIFFKGGPDPMVTYLVGSIVWLPAIGKPIDEFADIDVVFSGPGLAKLTATHIQETLERFDETDDLKLRYTVTKTGNSHYKVAREWHTRWDNKPSHVGIFDLWDMPVGATIMEYICAFQQAHEKAAFLCSTEAGDGSGLMRLMRTCSPSEIGISSDRDYGS